MRHIVAILWKQMKDTFKNKAILIQFLMFPVMTIIMENAMKIDNMPEHFFANLFAVMYIGMAPLTSMSAIISEEKEKNTLRVLHMSNVKAAEYFVGNALYIWSLCMLGSVVIGLAGGYQGEVLIKFMLVMAVGHLISTMMGATIGAFSKNQMMATGISVPVMMVFSFLPMLSMFNETIKSVAKVFYSQQLNLLIGSVQNLKIGTECIVVMGINVVLIGGAFVLSYRRIFNRT
ncbi:MAG: ABC transporter permease [Lachnospiraceae bacterium]|nr:ABC transporter permease [Lachnospiraceae bacterium]